MNTENVWDKVRWSLSKEIKFDFMTKYIYEYISKYVSFKNKTALELGSGLGRLSYLASNDHAEKVTLSFYVKSSITGTFGLNLYKPENKIINYNARPLDNIQKRARNLKSNDILVILGSHYFGPHIKRIFKNCFDIKLKQ